MKSAEFEEKDFEHPLYHQLLCGNHHLATPGQVFEGKFGVDALLEAQHPVFWNWFGYPQIPAGICLPLLDWNWVFGQHSHRRLPGFSVNLLVQSKRPDRLNGKNERLRHFGITGGYWRYSVAKHQQDLLNRVAATLGSKALVVYASTAFHTLDVLYRHTANRTMVENCSFVKVEHLNGHKTWNYNCAGTTGVACSKPSPIDDPPFPSQIATIAEQATYDAPADEELASLVRAVLDVCRARNAENPFARYFLRNHEIFTAATRELGIQRREIIDFATFRQFTNLLHAQWFVVGGKPLKQ